MPDYKDSKYSGGLSANIYMNTIYDICIPWIQRSYVDPVTGKEIDEKGKRHKELRKICHQHINFDLLGLTTLDETVKSEHLSYFRSKVLVSYKSVMYLSGLLKLYHPLKQFYGAVNSNRFIDSLDFGLYWDISNNRLGNCKHVNKFQSQFHVKVPAVIFINIVSLKDKLLYGCHVLIINNNIWERLAPVGAPVDFDINMMDTRIKRVFNKYIRNYYTPTSCPVNDVSGELSQLYCEIWDMWYVYERMVHDGYDEKWRERMYPVTVGRTLAHPELFAQFLTDYLTFMEQSKDHKCALTLTGHTTDDVLSDLLKT